MEILLLEDHQPTAQSVSWVLGSQHQVTHASSCDQAHFHLSLKNFDVMIVDLKLPDGSGLEFCQQTEVGDLTKVLVLSGSTTIQHKVAALNAGADDYLTKPFSAAELQARIHALTRRAKFIEQSVLKVGTLLLCVNERRLDVDDQQMSLTRAETRLLQIFLRHRDHLLTHGILLENGAEHNSLEAHIKNLRKKLKRFEREKCIETIYGVGYRFNSHYA